MPKKLHDLEKKIEATGKPKDQAWAIATAAYKKSKAKKKVKK